MKKILLSLLALASMNAFAADENITTYAKITSGDDLKVGSQYILVSDKQSDDAYYAMGASNGSSVTSKAYRNTVAITVADDACDLSGVDGVCIFTIENGNADGTYALKIVSSGNYITFTGEGTKEMNEGTTLDASSSFTIAFGSESGEAQIANASYTARGLKFNYNNGSNPRFANYAASSTNQPYGYLYVQKYVAPAAVSTPTFSVSSGLVTAGTTVEISCATEGADIYYTTDDTDPTSSSTKYTSAISINESCTLKAIAIKGSEQSSIATATYTVVEPVTLAQANALSNGETFVMGSDLLVVYANGSNNYVYDTSDGTYSLIYKSISATAGQIINKGWAGKMSYYAGLPELVPTEDVTFAEETGTIPDPTEVEASAIVNTMVNQYILVKNVVFESATPDATNSTFYGTVGDTSLTFRNPFNLAANEAGTYNVTCFVSIYTKNATTLGTTVQLNPVKYEAFTGIADIETESSAEAVYYNLQGVRVDNPENGLFIEVRGNKAVKVVK